MSTKEANGFFTTADSLRMQGAALIREDEKMKTWTMPKINVEGFAANEYVAACESVVDNKISYAADLVHPSSAHSSGLMADEDRTGMDDNLFNSAGYEMWYGTLSVSAASGYDGEFLRGWFYDKPVYVRVNGNITSGSFDDPTLFRYLGNFDIKVNQASTHLYTPGDHSSHVEKNHS